MASCLFLVRVWISLRRVAHVVGDTEQMQTRFPFAAFAAACFCLFLPNVFV